MDSQKNWVVLCSPLPKSLTLFLTKICDFPNFIYDLTKNLLPHLWPDRHVHSCPKHNLSMTVCFGCIDNDENLASSKRHTQFKVSANKNISIKDQNGQNRYPLDDQHG